MIGARRRGSGGKRITVPPMTDDFTGTLSGTKWPNQTAVASNVSGRLRVIPSASYPGVESAQIFNVTRYPISVQVPTLPIVGNGTIQTKMLLSNANYTSTAIFEISGNPRIIYMAGGGPNITGSTVTYDSVAHLWLRFRYDASAGNLLWETSPDDVTWTTRKTATAPSWITGALVKVILQTVQTGSAEASPGFAEFDNFNL